MKGDALSACRKAACRGAVPPTQRLLARVAGAQQADGGEIHPKGLESADELFTSCGFIVVANFRA